jgi:hypothetical protein
VVVGSAHAPSTQETVNINVIFETKVGVDNVVLPFKCFFIL